MCLECDVRFPPKTYEYVLCNNSIIISPLSSMSELSASLAVGLVSTMLAGWSQVRNPLFSVKPISSQVQLFAWVLKLTPPPLLIPPPAVRSLAGGMYPNCHLCTVHLTYCRDPIWVLCLFHYNFFRGTGQTSLFPVPGCVTVALTVCLGNSIILVIHTRRILKKSTRSILALSPSSPAIL